MIRRNKLILLLGEVLIPVLGYFWWDWNLYFIFLFLFLDLTAYNALYYFKYRKISEFNRMKIDGIKFTTTFVTLLFFLFSVFVSYSFLFNTIQNTHYMDEMIRFFFYEDMGFAQGYILLPLIILTAYMSYKTEFLMQGEFTRMSSNRLSAIYIRDNFFALLLTSVFLFFFLLGWTNEALYFFSGLTMYVGYKVAIELMEK